MANEPDPELQIVGYDPIPLTNAVMASHSLVLEEPISHTIVDPANTHSILPSNPPSGIELATIGDGDANANDAELQRSQTKTTIATQPHMTSKWQQAVLITSVAGCTFLNSLGNGLLTVGTPTMAKDLGLSKSLELWPASIFSLTCGCTLLLLGNVADAVGSRRVWLTGCLCYSVCSLVIGFIKTGTQLIVMRALQGIAVAAALPSAVALLTTNLPQGKSRNIGVAILGAGQPVGYAFGLLIIGLLIDTIGWRWGYYISAIINMVVLAAASWSLPKDKGKITWSTLKDGIDWVGSLLAMASLGLLSYTLANGANATENWKQPAMIACTVLSVVFSALFFRWVLRQERLGKPCIFPLSIWKNRAFASLCFIVFLSYASFNAITYLCSLFFQDVQRLTAQQTSIRLLPDVVCGIIVNVGVGLLVDKLSAYWIVLIATTATMTSSIILSTMHASWVYWAAAFPGVTLSVVSSDALYSIGVLVICSVFPQKTQGLAGGVFNTVTQLGNSVGLAVAGLIVGAVKEKYAPREKVMAPVLMESYRAGFWASLGATTLACLVSGVMLRRIGVVGLKRD